MKQTPESERLQIGLFGRRNSGKSSLINAIANQEVSLVSDIAGTTTDPVKKGIELFPAGPCLLIDTAGYDDFGTLGDMRKKRTSTMLERTDVAILLVDPVMGWGECEEELFTRLSAMKVPTLGVITKCDSQEAPNGLIELMNFKGLPYISASSVTGEGIEDIKNQISELASSAAMPETIIGDLVRPGDVVVLVVPVDFEAPKGRLILPQVQVLRDLLDNNATAFMTKEDRLKETLDKLSVKPRFVVTDSQAFETVNAQTPGDIPITGFSVLFARYKGDLDTLVKGARALDTLKPGDTILVAESCTHQIQCDDIGRIKFPRWINKFVGGEVNFEFVQGHDFPEDLSKYKLILQCGSCMTNRRELLRRISIAQQADIPIVNYGVAIAHLHGILDRALEVFNLNGTKGCECSKDGCCCPTE